MEYKNPCCNVDVSKLEGYVGHYALGETEEENVFNVFSHLYGTCENSDEGGYYDDYMKMENYSDYG